MFSPTTNMPHITLIDFVDSPRAGRLAFTLVGKPEAQPRPGGTCRRYNPKRALLHNMRAEMKTMVAAISAPHVLFEKDEKLVVEVKFFLPRPRTHVKMGGTTGGRLKAAIRESFQMAFVKRRIDVDNLSKFVLDAMNQSIYHDDTQVVKLVAMKLYNDVGECKGCTEVTIEKVWGPAQLGLNAGYYFDY